MSATLRCEAVAKSYGASPVLEGVDLEVPAGTVTAILGASGSGKTTLLRLVAGFEVPDAGRVNIADRCVSGEGTFVPPEQRGIGYVAQEGALFPHLSVGENVGFGLPRGLRRSSARIDEVLEAVGLDSTFGKRRPHQLSGGEQRRVSLARALAPRPAVIVLDEPFSGLDAGKRADTRSAVVQALAATGTTAVLVTHDQSEALSTGREVGVLSGGILVQTAAPEVLYRRPATLDVARFVGEAVVLPGVLGGSTVSCALGDLPVVRHAGGAAEGAEGAEGTVSVLVRPEQIAVFAADGSAADGSAAHGSAAHGSAAARSTAAHGSAPPGDVAARVLAVEYHGADGVVRMALNGGSGGPSASVEVTARVRGHEIPGTGDTVSLSVTGEVVAYPPEPAGRVAQGAG